MRATPLYLWQRRRAARITSRSKAAAPSREARSRTSMARRLSAEAALAEAKRTAAEQMILSMGFQPLKSRCGDDGWEITRRFKRNGVRSRADLRRSHKNGSPYRRVI